MAAALLLFITSWLVWYAGYHQPQLAVAPTTKGLRDPLLADLGRYDIKPVETNDPGDRIRAMAEAADKLYARGQKDVPAGTPVADVVALTKLYGRVLEEGILKPAEGLSADERKLVLIPIANRLHDAESEWSRLSQQTGLPAGVGTALKNAALAAREGEKKLRELCEAA